MAELNKSYDPKQVEDRIYRYWLDNNYFHATVNLTEAKTLIIEDQLLAG